MFFYPVLLRVVSPFHKKAKLMVKGRKGWEAKLTSLPKDGKRVWFHCASLGEFEQGRPLMENIKRKYPNHGIFITFFSSSGYEVQKDYASADLVGYLPFDGRRISKRFVELLNPDVAIFIKYEFWYYYLKTLKENNIPTFSVSAIFRPEQHFFKRGDRFFKSMLACFDHFFVQNETSKKLLNSHGFDNVTVSGDTRFDRVMEICSAPKDIAVAKHFRGDDKVMVVGSSWPEDMDVLLPTINDPKHPLKFIIAPHGVEASKIQQLCQSISMDFQCFSTYKSAENPCKVLIIDNIGMLSSLYQYGDLAYIGGAFGEGLHNTLEAATYGMPVLFGKGKDNKKYQESMDLVAIGGAFEVADANECRKVIDGLLDNGEEMGRASAASREYVRSKTGATKIIEEFLSVYL